MNDDFFGSLYIFGMIFFVISFLVNAGEMDRPLYEKNPEAGLVLVFNLLWFIPLVVAVIRGFYAITKIVVKAII